MTYRHNKSDRDKLRRSLLVYHAHNSDFPYPRTMTTAAAQNEVSDVEASETMATAVAQECEVSDEEEDDLASDDEDLQDDAPVLTSLVECCNRLSQEAQGQLSDSLKTAGLSGSTDIYVAISEGVLSEAIEGIITKLRNYARSRGSYEEDTSSWLWTGEVENVKFTMKEDKPDIFDRVQAEISLTAKGTGGAEKVQCQYLARSTWVPDRGWRPEVVARGDAWSAWRMRKIDDLNSSDLRR